MTERLKIAFIHHEDEALNRDVLPRWAASFADVVGTVLIREHGSVRKRRLRAEARRVGYLRLLDVFAFRLFYRFFIAREDAAWEQQEVATLIARWPVNPSVPVHITANPNDEDVAAFLRKLAPDLILARCKWLLKPSIYSSARLGTVVLHPGICPEYRNSHGCFWALANRDLDNVGLTLLKVDDGIDTGPVYEYFTYPFDESAESHIRIQHRMVTENFDKIRAALESLAKGELTPRDTRGRRSNNWGQPWLSKYLSWKRAARSAGRP